MLDTPFDRYEDHAATHTGTHTELDRFDDPVAVRDGGDAGDLHVLTAPRPAQQPAEHAAPRSYRSRGLIALGLALAIGAGWWISHGAAPAPAATPLPVVSAALPLERQITEWDEFVGRFRAIRTVEVRPQVSGQIVRIHFTDGQYVNAGAPLFTIDQRPFRAALAQAQAEVARAASALTLAEGNLARAQRLVSDDAVAPTEIDRLRAEVRNGRAALAAARALAQTRSIDLGYTVIRAPIAGRISDRRIDAGNLVAGGGGTAATLLTTINAVDPVYFEFTGSEALYLKARREGLTNGSPVQIRLADEADYRWHGKLDFTDNGLDPASGTIRARAIVDNREGLLAPGLFGRMRLAGGGTHAALLVPDTAIVTDQTAKQVLVVAADGTVSPRTVELGPQVGSLRVIRKGLKANERVVITGVQMAIPGQKVRALPARIAPSASQANVSAAAPADAAVPRAAAATIAN